MFEPVVQASAWRLGQSAIQLYSFTNVSDGIVYVVLVYICFVDDIAYSGPLYTILIP